MKKFQYLTMAAIAMFMTACGGSDSAATDGEGQDASATKDLVGVAGESMAPDSEEISGELGEYFTVEKKVYKYSGNLIQRMIIELKRTDKELPFTYSPDLQIIDPSSAKYRSEPFLAASFGINYLSADNDIIAKEDANSYNHVGSSSELLSLFALKPGEKGSLEVEIYNQEPLQAVKFHLTSTMNNKLAAQVDSVKTTSADRYVVVDDNDNDYDEDYDMDYDYDMDDSYVSTTTSSSSSSSNNIDALLTQYENEMNDYLRAIKNADYNNISSTLQKVTDTYTKICSQALSMTDAQRERLSNIYARMSNNF